MRDLPQSPRIIAIKKKQRKKTVFLIILFLLLCGLLVFGLSCLSQERHIVINTIKVNGAEVLTKDNIIKISKDEMSGKYFYLFARNNTFIYPKRGIQKSLLKNFPRIEELNIRLNGLNELEINIKERKGEYLYCGEAIPEDQNKIGDNCYFLNDDGLVFDKSPYFSGDIYFKYYLSLDEKTDFLGKKILDKDKFHDLTSFFNGINKLGLKSIYFYMDKDGINYLYLQKKENSSSPRIIFKDEDNLELLLDNLRLAMKKNEFIDEIKSKYNTLEYIDLRFKNKILYKFL